MPPAASWSAQGAFGVAQRQPSAGGSLWTTSHPEVREGGLGNIHPRAWGKEKPQTLTHCLATSHPSGRSVVIGGHHWL